GVDDAVPDEATDPLGEEVRVDLTEVGAVGEAVVVELLLADRTTQRVKVPGDVDRTHVGQQLAGVRATAGTGVLARGPLPPALVGRTPGHVVGTVVAGAAVVGVAAQRGDAAADP